MIAIISNTNTSTVQRHYFLIGIHVDYCDCDGHGRWIRDSREESKGVTVDSKPKGIVKQRAVRTNAKFLLNEGALDQSLNDGWTVVMCNKITDGLLEYILEKEIEE